MSRFVPTLAQLEEARKQLPSPYKHADDVRVRPICWRVPLLPSVEDSFPRVIDFRLDWEKDPDGFRWCRWVYEGPVAV